VENRDKITEKGRQIAKLNLESGYIYFRKNYNLLYVLLDFFLIIPFCFLSNIEEIFSFQEKY
jgi:hypothetical protein